MEKPINLVFLHGWGMNRMVWQPFIQQSNLGKLTNVNILTLDLPGFGENQYVLASEKYSLATVAEYLEQLLPENSVLVAWSLSGLVAQYLINKNCPKIIGQVQVCSTPKFTQETEWYGIKPTVLEQFAQQLTQDHHALLRRFLAIQCMGLDEPKLVFKKMNSALTGHPLSHPEALSSSLDILMTSDLRESTAFQRPSLRIFGGLDSLVPKRAIPLIKDIFKNDQIHLINKASHAPFISHSVEFEKAILKFLSQHFIEFTLN